MTLAQALRAARRRAGLTQLQVANRAGVAGGYLARLEQGQNSPPSAALMADLARALDADPDELCRLGGRLAPDMVAFLVRRPKMLAQIRAAMEKRERKVA